MRRSAFLGVLSLAAIGSFCGSTEETKSRPYAAVPESGKVKITGLTGPVDVVRDTYGMIHIRASSVQDALRVEGYQVARDRTAQLELVRRAATGRLAEILGDASPALIDNDISMRTLGLARAAKAMLAEAPPETRAWLEAYADGISQFNARARSGDEPLPVAMLGFSQDAYEPWTAADVLAVGRLQAFNLGFDADGEIADTEFAEAVRDKFKPGADANLAKRAGFLRDAMRFAPIDPTSPLDGFPKADTIAAKNGRPAPAVAAVGTTPRSREALAATRAFRAAIKEVRNLVGDKGGFTGSNNWVVGPSRTATGHAMLASDPHLSLSAPSTFWMVHVTVDGAATEPKLDFAGLAFPGLPGIILGFNANVAWGATTADFDVTDVYEETLSADGNGVVFKGQTVPLERVRETIKIAGKAPLEYDVLVAPHHGPLAPTIRPDHTIAPPAGKALSIKWTGHAATKDILSIFGMLGAKNVDEAKAALDNFEVGAQNWVVADTSGNIFYTSHARIPKRDRAAYAWNAATYTGNLPCFVLPGDGSAEWTGAFLENAFIPHDKNPTRAFIATANADQIGSTRDNDPSNEVLPTGEPMYLAAWHDVGFRAGRIVHRLENVGRPITLDDMALIQSDARSAMGDKLVPLLNQALVRAKAEAAAPGTHKDLSALVASDGWKAVPVAEIEELLGKWASESDFDAAAGVNLEDGSLAVDAKEITASRATTIFNAWMVRMFHATFDDELAAAGAPLAYDGRRMLLNVMLPEPSSLATYDAASQSSAIFDDLGTAAIETRDERILTSLVDALVFLKARLGEDRTAWRWGRLHTLRFTSLVSFWKSLSIPPESDPVFPRGFPRHGDGYNVDVAGFPLPGKLDASASFAYGHGPTQRFVIDMDPKGPVARNVLPGGNVWDSQSPHFRDEAERWRKNQNRPVAFAIGDVIAAAESRTVFEPSP